MRVLFLSPIGNIGGAERVLLTAIAGLRRERPGIAIGVLMYSDGPLAAAVRWFLIGGPIYRTAAQFTEAELRAAAEARGLTGQVGFIPFAADTAPLYRALDVVVHASTRPEPFGLTVAEAMACGRPVVVSAAGGAVELFTEGIDALGVAPGDSEGVANAVRRLVGDAELRARLGAAARRTAEARFDGTGYGRRLLAFYESLGSTRFIAITPVSPW